jgi:hypothetical protein
MQAKKPANKALRGAPKNKGRKFPILVEHPDGSREWLDPVTREPLNRLNGTTKPPSKQGPDFQGK